MRSVLDHRDAGAVGDRHERIEVGGAAEEVNGNDRLRAPADLPLHVGRADEVGVGIDVGEDWHAAETRHGAGGREEGVARQDHLVAGLDVEGHQGEEERVGAGGATDGVRHAQKPCQFGLEIGDVGAEDEPPGVTHPLDGRADLVPQSGVLPIEGEEPDLRQESLRLVGGCRLIGGRG